MKEINIDDVMITIGGKEVKPMKDGINHNYHKLYEVKLQYGVVMELVATNEEEAKEIAMDLWHELAKYSGEAEIEDVRRITNEEED